MSIICLFFDSYLISITNVYLQVTSVGINTEWGLLMASISEDTGEETPLQVTFPQIDSTRFYFQL